MAEILPFSANGTKSFPHKINMLSVNLYKIDLSNSLSLLKLTEYKGAVFLSHT